MSRPPDYEWSVLGEDSDPTPGDPYEVRDQAARLGRMGQTIRDQVRLLKNMAADDNLSVGQYADKLRDKARELESGLDTLATRYERVSGYLGHWADDLEHCQSESLRALQKAQEVAPSANAPQMTSTHPEHLTPEQETQKAAADKAREAAQGELADAKAQLQNTKAYYGERGYYWMQKIEDAEHDDLKDHGFGEWLSNEIHEHANLIKLLSDALTWAVTILVIASMFIPIVDIGTGALLLLMGLATAGHFALAANGDGSWTDFAMDIIALATLGSGGLAKAGLEASAKVADGIVAGASEGEAGEEGASAVAKGLSEGAEGAESSGTQSAFSRVGSKVANYREYLGNVKEGLGEPEAAEHYGKIQEAIKIKPDGRWAARVTNRAAHQFTVAKRASLIGNTADQIGHLGSKSDLINFGGNALHGHAVEDGHLNTEGNYAPHLVPGLDEFKKLTTYGVNGFTSE